MASKRISRRRNSRKYITGKRRSKWRQLKTRSHTIKVKGGRNRRKNRKINKSRKILKGGAEAQAQAEATTLLNSVLLSQEWRMHTREGPINEEPIEITVEDRKLSCGIVECISGGSWKKCLFIYVPTSKFLYYFDLKLVRPGRVSKALINKVEVDEASKENDTHFTIMAMFLDGRGGDYKQLRCKLTTIDPVYKWIEILPKPAPAPEPRKKEKAVWFEWDDLKPGKNTWGWWRKDEGQ